MIIGFTGTRHGMSATQKRQLEEALLAHRATEFHHGDCVGADAQADAICRRLGIARVVHPPTEGRARAHTPPGPDCTILKAEPYLIRNHDIVDACHLLIAAPDTLHERQRSGTWATVRYARKCGRPMHILILYPDRKYPQEDQ